MRGNGKKLVIESVEGLEGSGESGEGQTRDQMGEMKTVFHWELLLGVMGRVWKRGS